VNRRGASLVLVRAHIPTSIDTAPVLRSLRERLGEPTTGKDNLADDLRSGPSTWVSETCGIVVQASREGEHLWDPTRAGIYVEARILSRVADAVTPGRSAEALVVDEMLVAPVTAPVEAEQTTAAAAAATVAIEPVSAPTPTPSNIETASRLDPGTSDGVEIPSPGESSSDDVAVAGLDGVTYPERLERFYVKPVFPAAARFTRKSGTVHLRVVVGEDGRVGATEVVGVTPPDAGFEESAVEAVKRWRYRPATRDGKPVTAAIMVKVEFM